MSQSATVAAESAAENPILAPALNWQDVDAAFNYRIGDIEIGTVWLPVSSPTNYFLELEKAVDVRTLVPARGRGILIRSLPVAQPLRRIARRPGVVQYVPRCYRRYMTDMSLTAEQFLAGMSGKSRNTLKRKVRRFEEKFGPGIDCREYRTETDLPAYFEAAREVSRVTFQERLLDFGLPDSFEFKKKVEDQARAGNFRGNVLFAKGRPIAYVHTPLVNHTAIYAYLGFVPDYAEWSPGTVLQWLLMQRMFEDGEIRWFDFTEGQGPHKEFFSTQNWLCADVWLFRPTLRNWLLILSHAGLDSIGSVAGKVLNWLGLKKQVRRLLRGQ